LKILKKWDYSYHFRNKVQINITVFPYILFF
jgi:hypothetical protein